VVAQWLSYRPLILRLRLRIQEQNDGENFLFFRHKHSSLLYPIISDEEKRFTTLTQVEKVKAFFTLGGCNPGNVSDGFYLGQGVKEPRSHGAKEPRSRGTKELRSQLAEEPRTQGAKDLRN
jgi:hypothetical protein